jgi:rhamnosyl/mannosyltransferase
VTSRLRVLQLGKYYHPYPGGIETHLRVLAEALSANNDVEVLVHNNAKSTVRERVGQVDVTRAGTLGRLGATEFSPALIQALSGRDYDLLHLHTPNPMGMLAYCLAKKPAGHRLVVTHHSDVVRQIWLRRAFHPVFAEVMGRADAIVVGSTRYLESSAELRPHREKCVVIPFGIQTTEANGVIPPEVEAFALRSRGRVVLSIGRLVYYKGFDVLLSAMKRVDGSLVLVGSGPLERTLRERIDALSLHERVLLLGRVTEGELRQILRVAQVFALPSIARSEAFGIVQLEAMAAGLPVVNTDLDSGVPEVSVHGSTGLTVRPGDAVALADALTTLLDDAGLRARLGAAGRSRVEAEFDVGTMVGSIEGLYRAVAQGAFRARRLA